MGVVNRGVAVGDFHAPPAFERREQHEQIRDSITLVLVVVARLAPRLSGNSRARLKDQLFRGFVETHDGALGITRPLVDFQHVFHVGNEGRVGLRRDHPLLLEMRLENVFLRVRPIVLSLAHRTMLSSTTFCSRRRRLHLACPAGAGPHVSAISFASAAPSNIRGRAEFGLYLRVSTDSNPSSTSWRLVRSILAMLVSSASAIRLSLHPSPASDTSAFNRMRALVNNCAGRLPAWTKSSSRARSFALNRTTYFLTETSFAATNPAGAAASGGIGGSSGGIWTEAYPAPPSRIRSLLLVYPKLHRRPHESSCSFAAGLIARSCNPTRRRFSQVFKRLCTSVLIGLCSPNACMEAPFVSGCVRPPGPNATHGTP